MWIMTMNSLKYASLFSGGFGSANLAMNYENIKYTDVFACEWLKPQRESYELNHGKPNKFYTDARNIKGIRHFGQIDYLHASPPCTSFSMAGKREGLDSAEDDLMLDTIRIINEVQPKMFTVENVSALVSANNGEDWKEVLTQFKQLRGYTIQYGVMNAKDYGTPQNRKRIFIIGFRAKCGLMPFPTKVKLSLSVGDVLEKNVPKKYDISETMLKGFNKHTKRHKERGNGFKFEPKTKDSTHFGAISTNAGNRPTDNFIKETSTQIGNLYEGNPQGGRVYSVDGVAPAMSARAGGVGAKTGLFRVPHGAFTGGFQWVEVCPAITTSSWTFNNYFYKKERIRRLTPLECSRAMGDFDDNFIHGDFSDNKMYEFIGNAICLNTMRALIITMLKHSENINFTKPLRPIPIVKNTHQVQKGLFPEEIPAPKKSLFNKINKQDMRVLIKAVKRNSIACIFTDVPYKLTQGGVSPSNKNGMRSRVNGSVGLFEEVE